MATTMPSGLQAQAQALAQALGHGEARAPPHVRTGPPSDDMDNGLRLTTEMSRMFDGFAGGGVVHGVHQFGGHGVGDDYYGGGEVGGGSGSGGGYAGVGLFGHLGDGEGVYSHMKEMF